MSRAFHRLLCAGASVIALSATTLPCVAQFQYPASQLQVQPAAAPEPARVERASAQRGNMGGGFIEFLFSGNNNNEPLSLQPSTAPAPQIDPASAPDQIDPPGLLYQQQPDEIESAQTPVVGPAPARPAIDPRFLPQIVNYVGPEQPGTIVIDTRIKHLFLVENGGKALRYGVGVGKPGFLWAGVKTVSRKREWPDWTPPAEMILRRPDLPRHMEGGPENPLGARALYLGSSLYRIHGSNEPWTIGTNVSSGCIRMRNQDVMDLYDRVQVGAKVVVI